MVPLVLFMFAAEPNLVVPEQFVDYSLLAKQLYQLANSVISFEFLLQLFLPLFDAGVSSILQLYFVLPLFASLDGDIGNRPLLFGGLFVLDFNWHQLKSEAVVVSLRGLNSILTVDWLDSLHVAGDSGTGCPDFFLSDGLVVPGCQIRGLCLDAPLLMSVLLSQYILVASLLSCLVLFRSILGCAFGFVGLEGNVEIFLVAFNLFDSLVDLIDFAGDVPVILKLIVLPRFLFGLAMQILVS